VTEPTRLTVAAAHKGFVWADLVVRGVAAHGSRYDIGVDAIALAALVVAELERYQQAELVKRAHPLLGRPSLHASFVRGGTGLSTYPDACTVQFERRTLPGETSRDFIRELEDAVARVRAARPELDAVIVEGLSQAPNEVPADHRVVRMLTGALRAAHQADTVSGLSCWTDAAILTAAGIPAVCFGPGDIGVAHAHEEFVPVADVDAATSALAAVMSGWFADA
jgi:acetylornithine deacetylase